ncbi:DNA-directed RNA polymerase I subunit rpa49 [Lucilia cuprina]|uniref:DNA-directed RNA polymerase I subunit rpa49 n=1 Tax=Lucilia cuprina TaxID=7375 RepID=UPI001F070646|nr:DNA-directed RNA polymerase I subunit rpa49 [Lucilia cuprina]
MKEKVEIDKVYNRKKNGVVPTLLKFQNGKLSAFTKENTHFCRLRSRQDKNVMGALLVANGHTYQGLIDDSDASELTDTYICVRNKVTNKMTIIPIDQVTLKNSIYQDIDQTQREALSDHVRKMTLLKKFGGRKASRYINDKEKMHMDIKIVQEELQNTVEEAGLEENEAEESVDNTAYLDKIRPPMNVEAKQVSDVYALEDVVPMDLLNRLDEEAKTVYQTQIDQIPIQSEFLKKLIETIQQSPADKEGLDRLKLIIYMDSLLKLIKSRVKSLKKANLSDISEKVENNVRDRFSDPNSSFSGCRTSFSTEKALCHFIVLALLVSDNYSVDGAVLSQELNAPRSKVNKYAHIVQALPKSRTSILTLRLPKSVPPVPTSFAKRKKD